MSKQNDPSSKLQDEDSNFVEIIDKNIWHSRDKLDEVIATIKAQSLSDSFAWSWARSKGFRCKYVSIRFDMRDGAFTIQDKDGNRISLTELKYQRGNDDKMKEGN